MPQEIRVWEVINGDQLHEIPKTSLSKEEKIEEWIEKDISIISEDFLVIGRQVETDFKGYIDLLCIDQNSDLVIIELKKEKTTREIVGQILDYASWVKDLSSERVMEIANRYFASRGLESINAVFEKKFGEKMQETLNNAHRLFIVSSELDGSTEREINYLSSYGIGINALSFQYFQKENKVYLARVFLIEPEEVERRRRVSRSPNLTNEKLEEIARGKGVVDLFLRLRDELEAIFPENRNTKTSIGFVAQQEGKMKVIMSLIPVQSDSKNGLHFQVYLERISKFLDTDEETVKSLLPENKKEWSYGKGAPPEYSGYEGFFKQPEDVERFLTEIKKLKK